MPHKAETTVLTQSNELARIPMRWKVYKQLHIKQSDARVDRWIKERVEKIKSGYKGTAWKETGLLRGYVALHDHFTDEKGLASSCEVLIDLILKHGSVPRINTFVDVYNVISVMTGVSIGAHDIDQLVGNPRLEIINDDQSFKHIGGRGSGLAKRNEYAYVDDEGVICRMDIKQCDRTKITEKTQHVLMIFQGHEGLEESRLRESISLLDEVIDMFVH